MLHACAQSCRNKWIVQAAYGIMVEVESHPFEPDTVLFMDWRDDHFDGHPDMKAANQYVTRMLPGSVRDL